MNIREHSEYAECLHLLMFVHYYFYLQSLLIISKYQKYVEFPAEKDFDVKNKTQIKFA